jgi:hypothetical protein
MPQKGDFPVSKQNQKTKNKATPKKRMDPLMLAAAIACAVAVVAMVVVIAIKFTPKKGEFVAPPFDSAAVVGTPEVPDGLGWSEMDARGAFFVSVCGEVKLSDGKADVWFTNPEKNTVWLKLRVLNEQGEILAETGLIRPGEYVQTIHFDVLPEVGDNITMKVMAYEPDTYVSAGAVSLKTVIS